MNNPFIFACIAPYGGEIIPELQGEHPERMEVTRKSLTKLGEKMTKARPDCIIALSPHATRIDKAAKPLDQEVVQLIRADNLEGLAQSDENYIEAAKPNGIWQSLILAGAIGKKDKKSKFLSYEAPTYFGLLCAAYYKKYG